MNLVRDASLSAIVAGFVTVLVGFTSSAVIVFQAASAAGADAAELASWMWALGLGIGVTGIGLSLRYRMPVVTAWSTPGGALLATSTAGVPLAESIGAFVVCALLISATGFSGLFERAMKRLPLSLAAGMLAGVLLRFGIDVFVAMKTQAVLVLAMFGAYLAGRRAWPRYAVIGALGAGLAVAAARGMLDFADVPLELTRPVWVAPAFSVAATIGIAVPLFVVTMASQNVPGIATLRASGYDPPVSPIVGWTGIATLALAPFGAFALNLAAITAAICTGREAHEDPGRRYVAAVAAGAFYVLIGLFGAAVGALFAALPRELVLGIAGIALFGTIGNGLATALADDADREPALITFLVTASGVSLAGIGSAFWGLVAGVAALLVLRARRAETVRSPGTDK